MHSSRVPMVGLALCWLAVGQSSLFLRSRTIETSTGAQPATVGTIASPTGAVGPSGRQSRLALEGRQRHFLIQLDGVADSARLKQLADDGFRVLGYVPGDGLVVSADEERSLEASGIRWAGPILPTDKFELGSFRPGTGNYVVEFYADVESGFAREVLIGEEIVLKENPDLLPNQLLIEATEDQVVRLVAYDGVAFVYPAIDELVDGIPVVACVGAQTEAGPASPIGAVAIGEGWDGPGRGSAALTYRLATLTSKVPAAQVRQELVKVFEEWSRHAKITFTETTRANLSRSIEILFGSGPHGDPYPFDGRGSVLAHTFYPAPPNSEPLAGDLHFDDDELWTVGGNLDLFSTALHEIGHALGLGHLNVTGAVMYPFYRRASQLGQPDIDAIQALYAANTGTATPLPPVTPPVTPPATAVSVRVVSPVANPVQTSSTSLLISGTASHTSGIASVAWQNSRGGGGTASGSAAWSLAVTGLTPGENELTITARSRDGATASVALRITVTVSVSDFTAPSLRVTSPGTNNYATSASEIRISGTAVDNVGVAHVLWQSPTANGIATGTSTWATPAIPLVMGMNNLVIRAFDAAGNSSWRGITVTRR